MGGGGELLRKSSSLTKKEEEVVSFSLLCLNTLCSERQQPSVSGRADTDNMLRMTKEKVGKSLGP